MNSKHLGSGLNFYLLFLPALSSCAHDLWVIYLDVFLSTHRGLEFDVDLVPGKDTVGEKKKKKKKKKTQESEGPTNVDQTVSAGGNEEPEKKPSEAKSSQVRTFPNGLVIEELAMGKPDGKRSSPGKQVTLCLI